MSGPKSTQQLAMIEVGHIAFLLPSLKALQLMKLLQEGAKLAEWDFNSEWRAEGLRMHVNTRPIGEIRMTTVDSRQIQDTQPAAPRSRKRSDSVQVPESSGN